MQCKSCMRTLSLVAFYPSVQSGRWGQRLCIECSKENARQRRANPENHLQIRSTEIASQLTQRNRKRKKKMGCDVTGREIRWLWVFQNGLCADTGEPMTLSGKRKRKTPLRTAMSVDRIDHHKGYAKDNIRLVCHYVNMVRRDLPFDIWRSVVDKFDWKRLLHEEQ